MLLPSSRRAATLVLGLGALGVASALGHHDPRAEHLQHLPASIMLGTSGTFSGSAAAMQVYASPVTHTTVEAPAPVFYATLAFTPAETRF